jgi:RNA polymerase sigma factor (sigma-70 family)
VSPVTTTLADRPGLNLADVYREHHAHLLRYARHLTGSPDLAEDAVQEAYMAAWYKRHQFTPDPHRPAVAWLTGFTRVEALGERRAARRRPALAGEWVDWIPDADAPAEPDRRRPYVGLIVALLGLPPRQRQVLTLRYWDGLSTNATAERMGLKPRSVERLATQARARLRATLTAEGAAR